MMKRKFCCDATRGLYEDYYLSQSGSGIPVFQGSRTQVGHGLGSIFAGLFRFAMPLLKSLGITLGKQALRTGARIESDVAQGQSFTDSTKKRVGDTIKQYVPSFGNQSGSGKRRGRITKIKPLKKKKKLDIF